MPTKDKKPIYAKDLNAHGLMTVLLKEALDQMLYKHLKITSALIHGGPFANIAHGCNSIIATKTALKVSDYVVSRGFGADLGAEKFCNIKCRKAKIQLSQSCSCCNNKSNKNVHGGVEKDDLKKENLESFKKGLPNLERHVQNIKQFGLQIIVAINHFVTDTDKEIQAVKKNTALNLGSKLVLQTLG